MLRFFRRIRKTMISENKVVKYLLYASGEVMLIVIGIMIAISISNWNQNRQDEAKIAEIMKLVQQELQLDIAKKEPAQGGL